MLERQLKILEILNQNGKNDVSVLAETLKVSAVTIRKDLIFLEKEGLIRRSHGSAVIASDDDINYRMVYSYEIKKRIASNAAAMVKDGDTIMIESGSTCALLATEISTMCHDITIVTNSAFIAEHIRNNKGANVVLLGGDYDPIARVMVGPLVRLCAKEYYVEHYFVGVDGFSEDYGFHNLNIMRSEAVRVMAEYSEKTIVLTDSSKFLRRSVNKLMPLKDIYGVITDNNIPKETLEFLISNGIEVQTVES